MIPKTLIGAAIITWVALPLFSEPRVLGHYPLNENQHWLNSPYGIAFDSSLNEIWVAGYYSKNIVIIDATTKKTVASVPLPSYPTQISIGNNGKAYIKSWWNIYIFDTATRSLVKTFKPETNGFYSYLIAVKADPQEAAFYVISIYYDSNWQRHLRLQKYDADTYALIASTVLPQDSSWSWWQRDWLVGETHIYSVQVKYSNAKNVSEVLIFDKKDLSVAQTVRLGADSWPTGLALDQLTKTLYVGDYTGSQIFIIKKGPKSYTKGGKITGVSYPWKLGLDSVTHKLYSFNTWSNSLTVIDTLSKSIIKTLPTGYRPMDIAIDPTQSLAFVNNFYDHDVSIFDLKTDTLQTTINLSGYTPYDLALDPKTQQAYITVGISNGILTWDPKTATKGKFIRNYSLPGDLALFPNLRKGFFSTTVFCGNVPNIRKLDLNTNTIGRIRLYSGAGISAWPQNNKLLVSQQYSYDYQTWTATSESALRLLDASSESIIKKITLTESLKELTT